MLTTQHLIHNNIHTLTNKLSSRHPPNLSSTIPLIPLPPSNPHSHHHIRRLTHNRTSRSRNPTTHTQSINSLLQIRTNQNVITQLSRR